jgi:ParB/Sulfiredoxin domain
MTTEQSNTKSKMTPAKGIKAALRSKSQQRRDRYGQLAKVPKAKGNGRNDLLPTLAITYEPTDCLVEANRRLRKRDAVQVARVKASIAKFGVVVPVIVDSEMRIVHGHAVYDAARELGIIELPVVALSHLAPERTPALVDHP